MDDKDNQHYQKEMRQLSEKQSRKYYERKKAGEAGKSFIGQWSDVIKSLPMKVTVPQAPDVDLCIGVSVTEHGATVCLIQQHADGTATNIYSHTHPMGDSFSTARLAVLSEKK